MPASRVSGDHQLLRELKAEIGEAAALKVLRVFAGCLLELPLDDDVDRLERQVAVAREVDAAVAAADADPERIGVRAGEDRHLAPRQLAARRAGSQLGARYGIDMGTVRRDYAAATGKKMPCSRLDVPPVVGGGVVVGAVPQMGGQFLAYLAEAHGADVAERVRQRLVDAFAGEAIAVPAA